MSEKIVQLNEEVIKGQLKELVRVSVFQMVSVMGSHNCCPFCTSLLKRMMCRNQAAYRIILGWCKLNTYEWDS